MGHCSSKENPHCPTKGAALCHPLRGHANVVVQHDHDVRVQDCYNVDSHHVGVGSCGVVTKATHRATGVVHAVKDVSKVHVKRLDHFRREIDILRIMDHPNIIKLCETFEDQRTIHIVTEFCSGGQLFDRIILSDGGGFTERTAAICIQQIARAVHHMHEKLVCHRDLKPDNLMFLRSAPIEDNVLKVIDFGHATTFEKGHPVRTKCGSPFYSSPEVLAHKCTEAADLWSVGVIMYVILCGYPPFYGETEKDAVASVRRGSFSFPAKHWRNVSADAQHLIRHLLKMNPHDRYTAEQTLSHVWTSHTGMKHQVPLQPDFVNHLRFFRSMSKLKKATLQIIADQLDEEQIHKLRENFMAFDGNGDGWLTVAEMRQGLSQAGFDEIPGDLQQIMEEIDADDSGVIDYTEFLAATLEHKHYLKESVLWSAFSVFDRDRDGRVSRDELRQVLSSGSLENSMNAQDIDEVLWEVDNNCDGTLDFEEFIVMMNNGPLDEAARFEI